MCVRVAKLNPKFAHEKSTFEANILRITQSKIQIKLYSNRAKLVLYYLTKIKILSFTIEFHNSTFLFVLKDNFITVESIFIANVMITFPEHIFKQHYVSIMWQIQRSQPRDSRIYRYGNIAKKPKKVKKSLFRDFLFAINDSTEKNPKSRCQDSRIYLRIQCSRHVRNAEILSHYYVISFKVCSKSTTRNPKIIVLRS